MPDPGITPPVPVADGQQKLNVLAASKQFTPQDMVDYKNQQSAIMAKGGFSPQEVSQYWGDTPSTPPAASKAATGANLTAAAAAHPNGLQGVLKSAGDTLTSALDNVGILDSAQNFFGAWDQENAKTAAMYTQTGQSGAAAIRASAFANIGRTETGGVPTSLIEQAALPLVAPLHALGAVAGGGMTVTHALWSPIGAILDQADAAIDAVKLPSVTVPGINIQGGLTDAGGPKVQFGTYTTGTHFSPGLTSDEGFILASALMGGKGAEAALPEKIRAAAIDDTRKGALDGPADLPGQILGKDHPLAQQIAQSLPTADHFRYSALQYVMSLGGDNVSWTRLIPRVEKNLQDIYANTGIEPGVVVNRALTNPTIANELMQQDIAGDVVAPHLQVSAPPAPRPVVPHTTRAGLMGSAARAPLAQAASAAPAFEASIPNLAGLIARLEGSPDIHGLGQISRANARGIMQVEPATAAHFGFTDIGRLTNDDDYNKAAGMAAIADLYHRYNGDPEAVAIGYNTSPHYVRQWLNAGPGERLVAVRDNTQRSGWRYYSEAAARDEVHTLLPETQQYAARARYFMGRHAEPEPLPSELHTGDASWHANTPAESQAEIHAAAAEPEPEGAPSFREQETATLHGGSISAADTWERATPEEAADELAQNIGEQREPSRFGGMPWYDHFINQLFDHLTPANVMDRVLERLGANNPKDMDLRDWFANVTKSSHRALLTEEYGTLEGGPGNPSINFDGPTKAKAFAAVAKAGGNLRDFMLMLTAKRVHALEEPVYTRDAVIAARSEEVAAREGVEATKDHPNNTVRQKAQARLDNATAAVERAKAAHETAKTETGFNPGAAKNLAKNPAWNARYGEALDIFRGFKDGGLRYARDGGFLNDDRIAAMNRIGEYVPLRRIMGEDTSGPRTKGFAPGDPIKRMEGGSDRKTVDPLMASLDDHNAIIHATDANYALQQVRAAALKNPEFAARFGLRRSSEALRPDMDAVDNELRKLGFSEDQMEDARLAYGPLIEDRMVAGGLRNNQFIIRVDGKAETWETSMPALVEMLRGAPAYELPWIFKTMQNMAGAMRAGVEVMPGFIMRTFAQHQFIQSIFNEIHPAPVWTGLHSLFKTIGMDKLLIDTIAKGGLGTTMSGLGRDVTYQAMHDAFMKGGILKRVANDVGNWTEVSTLGEAAQKVGSAVLSPMRAERAVQERLSASNSVGLRVAGEKKGMTPMKAAANAAYAGIDYTNAMASRTMQTLSSMVPFFRPAQLYTANFIDAMRRNPVETATYSVAAITAPMVILHIVNHLQDMIPKGQPGYVPEEYKARNMHTWQKLYYYNLPYINGVRMHMRLPPAAGWAFGALPELMMQAMADHDPAGFTEIAQSFMQEYFHSPIPVGIGPALETILNRNFQTWQPLRPDSIKGANSELQYRPDTSNLAKGLTKWLGPAMRHTTDGQIDGLTPIDIDHMVNGWLGTGGQTMMQATGNGEPPAHDLTQAMVENPFFQGFFMRRPGEGHAADEYYDEQAKFQRGLASVGLLKKEFRQGDLANAAEVPEEVPLAHVANRLIRVDKVLNAQRAMIDQINRNPTMTTDEKNDKTTAIMEQQIALERGATEWMRKTRLAD